MSPKHIDRVELMNRVRRIIRVKIMKNLRFFNIISKAYFIDHRAVKLRYYYLYNDSSVDLNTLKRTIRDQKQKKDSDMKDMVKKLKKFEQLQQQNQVLPQTTTRMISTATHWLRCCKKQGSAAEASLLRNEPDYGYKDQIDIPLKFEQQNNFVFNPYKWYLIFWNTCLYFELLVILVFKPFCICFQDDHTSFVNIVDTIDAIHSVNLLDILIQMNTIFYERGEPVAQSSRIVKKFFRTRLWIETLGVLNCFFFILKQIVSTTNGEFADWINYIQLPLVIVWAAKLNRIEKTITDYLQLSEFYTYLLKIYKLLLLVLMLAHFVTCLWYLLLTFDTLGKSFYNPAIIYPTDITNLYLVTFYWVFTVMATIGFGEFIPMTTTQRIFCIALILFSTVVFAYTVNTIGSIYDEQKEIENRKKIKMVELNEYLRNKNVTRDLRVSQSF